MKGSAKIIDRICVAALILCSASAFPIVSMAHEDDKESSGQDYTGQDYKSGFASKFTLGLAAGFFRFDTNFKFIDQSTGRSVFVDGEGTLGLPEYDVTPMIYGVYRFSKRHGLSFGYFGVRRETAAVTVDANFGDMNVTGDVFLSDRTRFYYVNYSLTVYEDERAAVLASFGLNVIDLRYTLTADGQISIGGSPVASGEFHEGISQLTPLPMFGLDVWFAVTPRWAVGGKVALIAGKYKDVSAAVFETRLGSRFVFNKHIAALMGINDFSAKINIDKEDVRTEVNYGFDGVFAGIDLRF